MDLERERSALDSLQDSRLASTNPRPEKGEDKEKLKAGGLFANGIPDVGSSGNTDSNASPPQIDITGGAGEEKVVGNPVSSQPLSPKSPAGGSPPATKGLGLKKWRRIKRDVVKDVSATAESSKVLKRMLPASGNPSKFTDLTPVQIKPNTEDSIGSVNMFKYTAITEQFVTRGSSLESRFDAESAFAAGTDSENSEDWSSKSSTAASASRMRCEIPASVGYAQMNRNKIMNRNVIGRSGHHIQQRKGHAESSKKLREEKFKIEKENSHSSNESDSRGSNFVFMQGNYSVTSNRKQNGNSMNYNGENSDEANMAERLLGKEAGPGYARENIGEVEDLSEDGFIAEASWNGKEEKDENHQPAINKDPLLESIQTLQAVQDALENEVRKLAEVGTSSIPAGSSYSDLGVQESSSPDEFSFENVIQSSLLESQLCSLTENIKHLESSLEETSGLLKVKESRVAELEATLNDSRKEESGKSSDFLQERCRELEVEYESLFGQKIEAEIKCVALTRTIEKLRVRGGDQVTHFEQEEAVAGDHVKMLKEAARAESKPGKNSENLEDYGGDIDRTEEVLKIQRRLCAVTTCFSVQLILLILVFWLVVLQLSPHAGVVVPT